VDYTAGRGGIVAVENGHQRVALLGPSVHVLSGCLRASGFSGGCSESGGNEPVHTSEALPASKQPRLYIGQAHSSGPGYGEEQRGGRPLRRHAPVMLPGYRGRSHSPHVAAQ